VAHHMTMHGRHRSSTMPLLSGADANVTPVSWTYNHICRVVDGIVAEHCALLAQRYNATGARQTTSALPRASVETMRLFSNPDFSWPTP